MIFAFCDAVSRMSRTSSHRVTLDMGGRLTNISQQLSQKSPYLEGKLSQAFYYNIEIVL